MKTPVLNFTERIMRSVSQTKIRKLGNVISLFILLLFSVARMEAQCVSVCVQDLNVGLSCECSDTITVSMVLIDSGGCDGPFLLTLSLNGDPIPNNVVDSTMIGEDIDYELKDVMSGNSCEGVLHIMDENPPKISCDSNALISCLADIDTVSSDVVITDCSSESFSYSLDEIQPGYDDSCGDTVGYVIRAHIAEDFYGNTDTCYQDIYIARPSLDDLIFPADLSGSMAVICDDNTNVDPEFTGIPTINGQPVNPGTTCDYFSGYSDVTGQICGGSYKILRTWVIMDMCSGAMIDSVQLIEVVDTLAPFVSLIDTLRLAASSEECSMDVNLPAANASDECSDDLSFQITGPFPTLFTNGGLAPDVPIGTYEIVYRVTDECNLMTNDTLVLIIEDASPPNAICKSSITVPLNSDGLAWVGAEALDQGSTDNCGDVFFKVKRMNGDTTCFNSNPGNLFDDQIKLCCVDANNGTVMVILRIYDQDPGPGMVQDSILDGHWVECMVEITVQDKNAPSIVCPSDLTISCSYDYDPNDLDVFGTIVTNGIRDSICIDDEDNPNGPCLGIDGEAIDNCTSFVNDSSSIDIGMCQSGLITRFFTISDAFGNESECEQYITVQDFNPFYINEYNNNDPDDGVEWPKHFYTTDICDFDLLEPEHLPDSSAFPIIFENECDQVAVSKSDDIFNIGLGGQTCAKIIRTWTVMDWCQTENNEFKTWTYQQVIVIMNSVAPTITSDISPVEVCTDDEQCGPGYIELAIEVEDDCTPESFLVKRYRIDIGSNNDYEISGDGTDASGTYPLGDHKVLWIVEDLCGNEIQIAQDFSIINCKTPTPVCHDLVTTLMPVFIDNDNIPDDGMASIIAHQFDAGSYHVCGYEYTVSFSADVNNTIGLWDCSDLGVNDIEIWITDENGQQEFCVTTVTIQNSQDIPDCENFQEEETPTISGNLFNPDLVAMHDVEMELIGANMPLEFSDENGFYAFPDMDQGDSYEVMPYFEDDHDNGVSTLDIVKIQKHILGIDEFDSPYKNIAADVNKSGSITAIDIVEIRKLLLGYIPEFQSNEAWRFVDAQHDFEGVEFPESEEFNESYPIEELMEDMPNIDFYAVKIGDVNNSHEISGLIGENEDRSTEIVDLISEELLLQKGPNLISFTMNESEFSGFQLALRTTENIKVLDVISRLPGFSAANYNIVDREVKISWNGEINQSDDDIVVFELLIQAKETLLLSEALRMSSSSIQSELYKANYETFEINLSINGQMDANLGAPRFYPNPFEDYTTLEFDLETAEVVSLDFFDSSGKLAHAVRLSGEKGFNEYLVPSSAMPMEGIYYCRMSTSIETYVLKVISTNK